MYDVVHAAFWISGTNFPSLLLKYCLVGLRRFWNVLCCSGYVKTMYEGMGLSLALNYIIGII